MSKNSNGKAAEVIKIAVNIFFLIAGVISVVLWATSEHDDLRQWTAEQDYVTKQELQALVKDRYVPKEEVATLKEEVRNCEKEIERLRTQMDRIRGLSRINGRRAHILAPNNGQ
ncbi:MAG: hypothetical protein ACXADY_26295 [Candidatus Hodarchaeales archaeon]|jgi:uncharacterized protein YlxW (UPF0749 family)